MPIKITCRLHWSHHVVVAWLLLWQIGMDDAWTMMAQPAVTRLQRRSKTAPTTGTTTALAFTVSHDDHVAPPTTPTTTPVHPTVTVLTQRALQLTRQGGPTNLTAAHEAAHAWQTLLLDDDGCALPMAVQELAWPLYGHVLVRLGRDAEALPVWDQAMFVLQTNNNNDDKNKKMALLLAHKAASHQRLLQYRQAHDLYHAANHTMGAFCCAMRLGNLTLAHQWFVTSLPCAENSQEYDDASLSRSDHALIWKLLKQQQQQPPMAPNNNDAQMTFLLPLWVAKLAEKDDGSVASWLAGAMMLRTRQPFVPLPRRPLPPTLLLLSLATRMVWNVGPWDDWKLQILDDKVSLHQLLLRTLSIKNTTTTTTPLFWPRGYVWPDDKEAFQADNRHNHDDDDHTLWVCKDRAGYGSHGNTLQSTAEILELSLDSSSASAPSSSFLVQQLIDPPLLWQGRVFSMRVYVIYFMPCLAGSNDNCGNSGGAHYVVSRHGLVKMAAQPYKAPAQQENLDNKEQRKNVASRWTNSGRDAEGQQVDIQQWAESLPSAVVDDIWRQIDDAVEHVMTLYARECLEPSSLTAAQSFVAGGGFPKILGWDFLVNASHHVWLLEINRFPGLEARNEQDAPVKEAVLDQAWALAAQRWQIRHDKC